MSSRFGPFDSYPNGPWVATFQVTLFDDASYPGNLPNFTHGEIFLSVFANGDIIFAGGEITSFTMVDDNHFAFSATLATSKVVGVYETWIDTTTPLPATLPLFATGLGALGLMAWRRKHKVAA